MPCSRSARRPSVSRARFTYPSPRRRLVSSTCSSWSSKIDFESNSRRPIKVDFPSSTEPTIASRSCPVVSTIRYTLEVTLLLAVLHRRLGHAIVPPPLPALCEARGGDLAHDIGQRRSV